MPDAQAPGAQRLGARCPGARVPSATFPDAETRNPFVGTRTRKTRAMQARTMSIHGESARNEESYNENTQREQHRRWFSSAMGSNTWARVYNLCAQSERNKIQRAYFLFKAPPDKNNIQMLFIFSARVLNVSAPTVCVLIACAFMVFSLCAFDLFLEVGITLGHFQANT